MLVLIAGTLIGAALTRGVRPNSPAHATVDSVPRLTTGKAKSDGPPALAAKLTAATTAALQVPNWPLGPSDDQFPGLVPRPAVIPGLDRWQIASRLVCALPENEDWSPDGHSVACIGSDELIRVFDIKTMRLLRAWPAPKVKCIDWSGDGKFIASGGIDGIIRLWNANEGSPGRILSEKNGKFVHSVSFSPDSRVIASMKEADPGLRFWDVATGDVTSSKVLPHPLVVLDIAWSADGKSLATACDEKVIRVWDVSTGVVRHLLSGHTATATGIAFSADATRLVSTGFDRKVRVWSLASGSEERSWDGGGIAIDVSKLGVIAAVSQSGPKIRLWDLATGTERPSCAGHDSEFQWARPIRFSRDGLSLASVNQDGAVKVWDPQSGAALGVAQPHGHESYSIAVDPEGKTLATAGYLAESARLWNVSDGKLRLVLRTPACRYYRYVAFSPDGREVGTCGGDLPFLQLAEEEHSVRLWSARDGTPGPVLAGHTGKVFALAYSPDGRRIASAGWDRNIRIWDRSTGTTERLLKTELGVVGLYFTPDGRQIAAFGWPNSLRFWDVHSGSIGPNITIKNEELTGVAFHPGGAEFATAQGHRGACIWNLATSSIVRDIAPPEGMSVAISPDGKLLAAATFAQFLRESRFEIMSGDYWPEPCSDTAAESEASAFRPIRASWCQEASTARFVSGMSRRACRCA